MAKTKYQSRDFGTPSIKNDQPDIEIKRTVGRPRQWDEDMTARFKKGTFARIEALLKDRETKVDFINAAVTREIVRREKRK